MISLFHLLGMIAAIAKLIRQQISESLELFQHSKHHDSVIVAISYFLYLIGLAFIANLG